MLSTGADTTSGHRMEEARACSILARLADRATLGRATSCPGQSGR